MSRKAGRAIKSYSDMKYKNLNKAYSSYDTDNSQKLDMTELLKLTVEQNLQVSHDELEALLHHCDENGDGQISYGEFQRGLGRLATDHHVGPFGGNDTGVVRGFANKGGSQMMFNDNLHVSPEDALHVKPMVIHPELPTVVNAADPKQLSMYVKQLSSKVESKYKKMRDAFRAIDTDKSGHLSKEEMEAAVGHFALPIPLNHVHQIFDELADRDGSGHLDYNEFVRVLQSKDVHFE